MLKGDGSSVTFYVMDDYEQRGYRTIPVGKNLKPYENAIHEDLVRINQKHIVNLKHVLVLQKEHGVLLRLPVGYQTHITRPYLKSIQALLGLHKEKKTLA